MSFFPIGLTRSSLGVFFREGMGGVVGVLVRRPWAVSWAWWMGRIEWPRETGQVAPQQAAPRQPKWHAWSDWLVAKLAARPDSNLRELQAALKQERGVDVCLMTICNACQALEQSRKKRR